MYLTIFFFFFYRCHMLQDVIIYYCNTGQEGQGCNCSPDKEDLLNH
jgi:hypothetical protein